MATAMLEKHLTTFAEQTNFSGVVLVAKDGKILCSKAYGFDTAMYRFMP